MARPTRAGGAVVEQYPRVTFPVGVNPGPARPHAKPSSTMTIAPELPGVGCPGPFVDDGVPGRFERPRTRQPIPMAPPPRARDLDRFECESARTPLHRGSRVR